MTQNHTFEPDGRAVAYADEGDGPALVLLPGRDLSIETLATLAHVLTEEGFRVVRIGHRRPGGGGGSARPATVDGLAQDVVDVLDHIDLADAWVGGHAFGGSVARAVSAGHVDRVNGVLLLGVEADLEGSSLAPGVPVLAIQGSDDPVLPPANGERLQAEAPDRVSVVTIAGAGHLFPSTHAGETAGEIEDYLDWD